MMILRRLFSPTWRQANAMRKHVLRILAHQRDVLPPKAVSDIQAALDQLDQAIRGDSADAVTKQMANLEETANACFHSYPSASWRENTEVLLVALTVAMGVRTFFVQPFKIPTGSMQPTLFGVTSDNLIHHPEIQFPTGFQRIKEWFQGVSYVHLVAEEDGEFQGASQPMRLLILNISQTIQVGDRLYKLWFPPDFGAPPSGSVETRAELHRGQFFHKGEDIIRMRVRAGDHLFVDRITYNFRPPKRGEIVVFETHGISGLTPDQQDTFYIKRLVGLGGETIAIQPEYEVTGVPGFGNVPVGHVSINGTPLNAATPHFQSVYSFYGATEGSKAITYHENHYLGHGMLWFLEPGSEYHIRTNSLFVMGDNTMNSSDSRRWGDFSQQNVIGRSFFVYWPFTDRFGWSCIDR